jgi:hypothetical protein
VDWISDEETWDGIHMKLKDCRSMSTEKVALPIDHTIVRAIRSMSSVHDSEWGLVV